MVFVELHVSGVWYVVHTVFEDNEGAKNLVRNRVCTSNWKPVDVQHHFFGSYFYRGVIQYYVESRDQHAGVFTKPLDYTTFCYHWDFLLNI